MNNLHVLASFFGLVAILSVKIGSVEGLVEGQVAESAQFSYHVAIKVKDGNSLCNGAIISRQHIASAASCFIDKNLKFKDTIYTVIVGTNKIHKIGVDELDVERIFVSKEFQAMVVNGQIIHSVGNIAVLKLKSMLTLGRSIRKVHLPDDSLSNYPDHQPIVTGFGYNFRSTKIATNLFDVCNKLHYSEANIMPHYQCQRLSNFPLHENYLCAQMKQINPANPGGTCYGDGGGPLVVEGHTLVGILSDTRIDCNEQKYPALYTRVSSYASFIRRAIIEAPSSYDTRYAVYTSKGTENSTSGGRMKLEEYFYQD